MLGRSQRQQQQKQPVHEIRSGALKAAIWVNEAKFGLHHAATFQWVYKDGEEWETTDSFNREDLPLLTKSPT